MLGSVSKNNEHGQRRNSMVFEAIILFCGAFNV